MKKLSRALIVMLFALVCTFSLSGCFLMTKKYTITFHANGGVFDNGAESTSVKYERGKQIFGRPEPTRDGFTLLGWTDDADSTSQINFISYKVSGDDDLYALWTPANPSITFSSDFTEANDFYHEYRTVVDSSVTQFSFADHVTCSCDWEICNVAGTTVYNLYPGDNYYTLQTVDEYGSSLRTYRVNVHRSRTVTIEYEIGYTIANTVEVPSGYPYTVDTSIGADLEGRTVVGWRYGIDAVTEFTPLHDMTLEAILKYSDYNVTYDTNGGELSYDTTTATYQSYLRLAYPSREGYHFLGWYDGETKVGDGNANVMWTIPRDVTLVAKWELMRINVTASSNLAAGGSASYGSGTFYYGDPITLTATLNSGYTFLGWYDGDGSKANFLSNELVFETTVSVGGKYQARYQKSRLTVNTNRGNVIVPDTTIVGKPCTVSPEYSSLHGLTFAGWYQSGRKVCDDPEYTFEMTSDTITLFAEWANPALNVFELDVTDVSCTVVGIKSGYSTPAHLVIPDEVTAIGASAFYQNEKLLTVTIGDGVTEIGNAAFASCPLLVGVYVGSAVETVGLNVFSSCHKLVELKKPADIEFGGNVTPLHIYSDGDSFIDFGDDGYIFYIDEAADERHLLGYTGSETSLVLPDDFDYTIYKYAFANSQTLAGVTIAPETTAIGERAFFGCKNLATINYGATNATVGDNVFGKANSADIFKYAHVTIAANVTHVPDKLFYSTYQINVSSLVFEQNSMCEYIGSQAFSSLAISTITVPERVTTIGARAYYGCTAATNIDFRATALGPIGSSDTPFGAVGKSTTAGATLNIGANVTIIPDYLFFNSQDSFRPSIKSIAFEENSALEEIGSRAFFGITTLKSIVIPSGVTTIGTRAFASCTGITAIEYSAAELDVTDASSLLLFNGSCTDAAVAVTIGASVKFIPANLFKNMTKVSSLAFAPNSMCETIGAYAFYATEITAINIPDSVTAIGERAFYNCTQVSSLTVGTGLVTVGTYAFYAMNNLSFIKWNAIAAADNQNIFVSVGSAQASGITLTIGAAVTKIPARMFNVESNTKPNLTEITFEEFILYNPQDVEIGDHAFAGITSLKTVTISRRVTAIGADAFTGCTGIRTLNYQANLPDFEKSPFENSSSSIINIDKSVTRIPANIFGTTDPSKRVLVGTINFQTPSVCTEIGERAFYNCIFNETVLPESLTTIGTGAFGKSAESEITTLAIDKNVTSIGVGAFENRVIKTISFNAANCNDFTLDNPCFTSCEKITFGADVERVPSYLTYSLSQRPSFATGSKCTEIGEGAFYDSRGSSLSLPASVERIGAYAYYESRLRSAEMPSGVTEIGDYAFSRCGSMESINLSNVTKVGVGAFKASPIGDWNKVVNLSTKLVEIGEEAFAANIYLREITLPASLKRIGARAFQGSHNVRPTFASPSGWYVNDTAIPVTELDTVSAAKTALLTTYVEYEWVKD